MGRNLEEQSKFARGRKETTGMHAGKRKVI
jgi:hypothetical protein